MQFLTTQYSLSRLLPLLGLLLTIGGCAVNPVSGEQDFVLLTEEEELETGQRYHAQLIQQYPPYPDPSLQAYVTRVGQSLAAVSHREILTFRFTVLDTPEINAFALPGGFVYITRGLLAYLNSEAELAGVLGHEIGHITARHSVRQQSTARVTDFVGEWLDIATGQEPARGVFTQLGFALTRGYGRRHELEADQLGMEYLARAGYPPQKMIDVIKLLRNQDRFQREHRDPDSAETQTYHNVFSSHPDHEKRLNDLVEDAAAYPVAARSEGREEYLRQLDGLSFGYSEIDGVIRGNRFYHRLLDAQLTAPAGWTIHNFPDRLLFVAPGQSALVQVRLYPHGTTVEPREFLLHQLQRETLGDPQEFTQEGHTGFSGVTRVEKTPYGPRDVHYSAIRRPDYYWLFAYTAREADDFPRLIPGFRQLLASFSALGDAERQLARPLRVTVKRNPGGWRYTSLARHSPLQDHPEQQLRLLNGDYPDGDPEPGALIKLLE